ncbi:unnamed protein product [Lactuca virosa]|uniref:Polyphenol oxidase C-terminal domain-containing protein n=1 Tax=Lactuca virosa TaxID=75947 RepID=A0AAU9M7V5_9ASTR|nr:unnamed protein product [Lactuca virosa]
MNSMTGVRIELTELLEEINADGDDSVQVTIVPRVGHLRGPVTYCSSTDRLSSPPALAPPPASLSAPPSSPVKLIDNIRLGSSMAKENRDIIRSQFTFSLE